MIGCRFVMVMKLFEILYEIVYPLRIQKLTQSAIGSEVDIVESHLSDHL